MSLEYVYPGRHRNTESQLTRIYVYPQYKLNMYTKNSIEHVYIKCL